MGLRVAVIGLSPETHGLAPWFDPGWERWGLPWDGNWALLDRCFEMHDYRLLTSEHSRRPKDYLERLTHCNRLYMQKASRRLKAREYPFDEVAKSIGAYYFNSSCSYAMAMAIHEGAEEIGIWGCDMGSDGEYGYQRPNMEYLVGVARGKGIKVTIPDESSLCKFIGTGIRFGEHLPVYKDRYGWLG